jgi:uncharacterized membrane protein YjgN (DUF898 family)
LSHSFTCLRQNNTVWGNRVAAGSERSKNEISRGQMFEFKGGAATYWGTALLGGLITILTIGILYPFALVLLERWRAKHSYIDGRQLVFKGSAIGLFGRWLLWLLLIVITLGIYSFWVIPAIQKWKWDNTKFA